MNLIDPIGLLKSELTTSAKATDINNYSIGKYSYPEDVGTSPDLQHTMVFFINVRSNSEYSSKQKVLFEVGDQPVITKSGVVGAIGVATVGAMAATAVSSLSASAMSKKIAGGHNLKSVVGQQVAKSAVAIGKAAGVGALVGATALTFSASKMYRLKDAITLAVQEPPKTSYKMNYDKMDAGTLMGGMSTAPWAATAMAQAGIIKFASIPSAVGAPEFGKGIQKMAGESTNPFRTVLFQDVDLRTFTFNYKFMPKTKVEAENVKNIIKTFKLHMHPEFSTSKVFLIHPSEFNIVYYYKGKENDEWNKISTCVLTDLDVDAGAEQLATFHDGKSVEINLKLTFMETEMMTREKIEQGF